MDSIHSSCVVLAIEHKMWNLNILIELILPTLARNQPTYMEFRPCPEIIFFIRLLLHYYTE